MKRKWIKSLFPVAILAVWTGMAITGLAKEEAAEGSLFAMDTYMTFKAFGDRKQEAVDAAMAEVQRLDALWSVGLADSEISKLNEEKNGQVSEDTAVLLSSAVYFNELTEGAFDCTIYPLMDLWGFTTQNYYVPTTEEIDALLPGVDSSGISIELNDEGAYVEIREDQKVDLGAIAKGFTSARIMDVFKEYGVTSGMVSLGGNIQVLGVKPDGSKWNVGIRDPKGSAFDSLVSVRVDNKALVTSGGYERFFEQDGKTYIHILDPKTGIPVEGDIASATIISEDGTLCDALSTSLFLMGIEKSCSFWKEHADEFDFVLVDHDNNVIITEGIQEDFNDFRKSGKLEIITKE